MKLAMREPIFVEFADACMKILHPATQHKQPLSDEQITELVREAIDGEESSSAA